MRSVFHYRNHLIVLNTWNGAIWIERAGVCLAMVSSVEEGKRQIDQLA